MTSSEPFSYSPQSKTLTPALSVNHPEINFVLADYQWEHRILLIFAPFERSPAYQQQMAYWDEEGVQERELKLVEVLGSAGQVGGQPISSASVEKLRGCLRSIKDSYTCPPAHSGGLPNQCSFKVSQNGGFRGRIGSNLNFSDILSGNTLELPQGSLR